MSGPNRQKGTGTPGAEIEIRQSPFKYWLSIGFVVVFIAFVEWYIGWGELLAPWRLLAPEVAAIGLGVLMSTYLVRALRVFSYFHDRMRGRFVLCVKLVWSHNFLNYVLPMRAGEMAFPVLMSRYFDVPVTSSLPVLVWFRFLDLHSLILLALMALPLLDVPLIAVSAVAACWLLVPWLAYRFQRVIGQRIERSGREGKWALLFKAFASLPQDDARFFAAWAWTLANWLAKLAVVSIGIVVFIDPPFLYALAAAAAGELTMVLPIHSMAGAGTYEAGLVAVIQAAGVPIDTALAGSINLHLFLIFGTVVTGIIAVALPSPDSKH